MLMGSRLRIVAVLIGLLVLIPLALYLCLLGTGQVYVAQDNPQYLASPMQNLPSNMLRGMFNNFVSFHLPGVAPTKQLIVPVMQFSHIFLNLLFLFCNAAIMPLLALPVFILGLFCIPYALFAGDWSYFFFGLLGMIAAPLLVMVGAVVAFLVWLILLFQSGTTAYTTLWCVLGLPFLGLGFLSGAAPSGITVIIIRG